MVKKEIKALMVEPGKHPQVVVLNDDLDSLQKAVSIGAGYQGLIEVISIGAGDCIQEDQPHETVIAKEVADLTDLPSIKALALVKSTSHIQVGNRYYVSEIVLRAALNPDTAMK